jgi:hypothetical protein
MEFVFQDFVSRREEQTNGKGKERAYGPAAGGGVSPRRTRVDSGKKKEKKSNMT